MRWHWDILEFGCMSLWRYYCSIGSRFDTSTHLFLRLWWPSGPWRCRWSLLWHFLPQHRLSKSHLHMNLQLGHIHLGHGHEQDRWEHCHRRMWRFSAIWEGLLRYRLEECGRRSYRLRTTWTIVEQVSLSELKSSPQLRKTYQFGVQ